MQIVGTVIDKTWIVAHKVWLLVPAIIAAGILVLVILSIPSCQKPPVTPIATINTLQTELEKPLLAQIEEQKKQVADYKSRLTVSEGRYAGMVQKYVDLEKRKASVAKPTTNKEMRDRFAALGYVPLAAK